MSKISIVVPTIRPEQAEVFDSKWKDLIKKHNCELIIVNDGDTPFINHNNSILGIEDIMGDYSDTIYNLNDGIRNLGFALAAKIKSDYIISLDDDVYPIGDTIQDHLNALNKKYPISWINTSMTDYMRGFPYNLKEESECWVSHGVWDGVPDLDARTQLSIGVNKQDYYRGPIPKDILFPCCMMNCAFRAEALQYIYQAPMFDNIQRFADIWGGIEMKKDLDRLNRCVVSGYSRVFHDRKSDPKDNLIKESRGIEMNDDYEEIEYFDIFKQKRDRWKEFINKLY